jgi:pilus assembly protein CpaB
MLGRRLRLRGSGAYLALSIALAAASGLVVFSSVARYRAQAAALQPEVSVVLAARPILRGQAIRPDDVLEHRLPQAFAPPRALSGIDQVAGRVLLADLAPGEAVTETRLARVRAGPVASLVPRGLRAFAVPSSLPRGALVPGDRVDVLATFASGQPHTELVVFGVEVLMVLGPPGANDRPAGGPADDMEAEAVAAGGGDRGGLLILLVSPEQQQRLAYARAFANLEVTVAPAGE